MGAALPYTLSSVSELKLPTKKLVAVDLEKTMVEATVEKMLYLLLVFAFLWFLVMAWANWPPRDARGILKMPSITVDMTG